MKQTTIILATLILTVIVGTMAAPMAWTMSSQTPNQISDQDISDAYIYLLGRLLVLRQQQLDFKNEDFEWNKIIHHKPGDVAWANPNLDVAYSEAWIAIDANNPAIIEVPEIPSGRYYVWQMLNGWGETILNINERIFKDQPYGKYALVLKGSNPAIPADALRVELPCKKSRVLVRVELGSDPAYAIDLQRQFKLSVSRNVKIDPPIDIEMFSNDKLPGAIAFENASEILAGDPDINEGMDRLQEKVKAVEAVIQSGETGRALVEEVIQYQAIPHFHEAISDLGVIKNGWGRPNLTGNYGDDYVSRTAINYIGIWANNAGEVVYYKNNLDGTGSPLVGSNTYRIDFPKRELPIDKVTYFWSITAVDSVRFHVIPNELDRYVLGKASDVKLNDDGSLTLWFAPEKPTEAYDANWLPTPKGENYYLTFRYYGPSEDVVFGLYFPPEIVR